MSSVDTRTKRQKLEAMASQTASPNEARIAREKLEAMKPDTGERITARPYATYDPRPSDYIIIEMRYHGRPVDVYIYDDGGVELRWS